MDFYEKLSLYYDGIFPASESDMAFLAGRFAACRDIVDLGCGTGNKTAFLAAPGRRVLGLDLDRAMIERAKERHSPEGVEYRAMDMASAPDALEAGSFDGALCLGNSLVHLDGPEAIGIFLSGIKGLLRPGGLLALQILNYDRILDGAVRDLPPLESPEALFERRYLPQGRHLRFITALTVKQSGERLEGESLLYPLRRNELTTLLHQAGFDEADWRGGYDGSPLTEASFALIVLCRR